MEKSIGEQLNEMLHNASLSYTRNVLRTKQDLDDLDEINRRAEEKQAGLNKAYHADYGKRFEMAHGELLRKAAQFNFNHPPPPGGDSDRAAFLKQEAHRQVRTAHEVELIRVREEAQQALESLLDRANRRDQVRNMAREAFLRASDRRSGDDRRIRRNGPSRAN